MLPQPLGLKRSAAAAARRARRRARRSICAPPSGWRRSTAATRCWRRSRRAAKGWPRRASSSSCCWRRVPDAPGRRIVLRYENGAPALVEAEVGRGPGPAAHHAVDREWTDLPIRPGFLPLVQEAARYLAGAPSGDATADDRRRASKREMSLGRRRPARSRSSSRAANRAGCTPRPRTRASRARGTRCCSTETDEPGLYRVRAARADGTVAERPGRGVRGHLSLPFVELLEEGSCVKCRFWYPGRFGP